MINGRHRSDNTDRPDARLHAIESAHLAALPPLGSF